MHSVCSLLELLLLPLLLLLLLLLLPSVVVGQYDDVSYQLEPGYLRS